jgi:formylglycine-generating enzyme required for sulfatase activity
LPAQQTNSIASKATKEKPFVNSLGMKFVPVPGTKVLFCIWQTRVKDYQAFVQATNRPWPKPDFNQAPDHPAVNVNWNDAHAFCAWLTRKDRKEGFLTGKEHYRVPTDEEWSWAVGIGDKEKPGTPKEKDSGVNGVFPWGTQWPPPANIGNYGPSLKVDKFERTSPVGSFAANGLGLFDLGGNIWEACEDWYDVGTTLVLRGGSYDETDSRVLISSYRRLCPPDYTDELIGFRVVLVPEPVP